MSEFTKGPWTAGCDRDDIDESNVILAGDVVIARVEDAPEIRERYRNGKIEGPGSTAACDSLDEVDANARLIASAPDAHAILTELREHHRRNPEDMREAMEYGPCFMERIESYFAKVEGSDNG